MSAPVLRRASLRLLDSLRRIGFYDCWANGAGGRSFEAQVPLQAIVDAVSIRASLSGLRMMNTSVSWPASFQANEAVATVSPPSRNRKPRVPLIVASSSVPDAHQTCRPAWMKRSRSEEHTSELQSLMRISYAVFCLKKNK